MIDWERVKELRSEVGAEDFEEVVEIFIEEVDEVVERMQSGQSTAPLGEELHFLKGSSLNLGFATFSSLCSAGEQKAASNPEEIDLKELFGSYAASKKTFLDELGNLS